MTSKAGWKIVKFGNIAENIAIRVDPAQAETDIYVGLEHLDPETIHLKYMRKLAESRPVREIVQRTVAQIPVAR